jgi:urea carboxylase
VIIYQVHYDPMVISQAHVLSALVDVETTLPDTLDATEFLGRRITLPIVLDDRWNREALDRYRRSIRDKAVYLPSNIEYLAKNNGLDGGSAEALQLLVKSDWVCGASETGRPHLRLALIIICSSYSASAFILRAHSSSL